MEELLRTMIGKFNGEVSKKEKYQQELAGKVRTIQMEITDEKSYIVTLKDSQLVEFGPGEFETPDLKVIVDSATLQGLIDKTVKPMKALATRKLVIEGSLADKLLMRKLVA